MGLFKSILSSVANSVVNKIGDEVKEGISNKIQEGVNDLNRNDDTINHNITLLKNSIKEGKEDGFLETISKKEKKDMICRLGEKKTCNDFSDESIAELKCQIKCIDVLIKSIKEDEEYGK